MTTNARIWLAGIALLAIFALIQASGNSYAQGGDELPAVVRKIAAALKKGDADAAKKLTTATVKNVKLIDEISDLMHMYRPVDKGGLGIEKALKNLAPKDADEIAHLTMAMADLTLAKGWPKDQGKKTKKAWNEFTEEMRDAAVDLAKANNAKAVKTAATKVNNACTRCHSIFKE